MAEVSNLSKINAMTKSMTTNIESMHTFLAEHHQGTAMASEKIAKELKTISSVCAKNRETNTKIQNTTATNNSLLTDIKKVLIQTIIFKILNICVQGKQNVSFTDTFQTPDKRSPTLPPTPKSASPGPPKQCRECGSSTHMQRNCPKAPFCARYRLKI